MPINVTETLRRALNQLEAERTRVDRQIMAVRMVLGATAPRNSDARTPLSAAARKAISKRMKAYWAKRKANAR